MFGSLVHTLSLNQGAAIYVLGATKTCPQPFSVVFGEPQTIFKDADRHLQSMYNESILATLSAAMTLLSTVS